MSKAASAGGDLSGAACPRVAAAKQQGAKASPKSSRRADMLHRLTREPLLHFLLLGGLIFLVFGRGRPDPPAGGTEIVVTAADVDRIAGAFAATGQRPP